VPDCWLLICVSNERTQGAKHFRLAAFPWVRLWFDQLFCRSAKSLPSARQASAVRFL